MNGRMLRAAAAAALLLLAGATAWAAIPVVDVGAIDQLLQQVEAWREQLRDMQLQLEQLRQTREALTGARGMEGVLPIALAARNYLPPDWTAVAQLLSGSASAYRELANAVRAQVEANAVLSAEDLARLPATVTGVLADQRDGVATVQALTRAAYARSSDRFAALMALIDAIGGTDDAKAIAELQGRIGAEQAMLANEAVKLVALAQMQDGDRQARELAQRESVVKNHGAFGRRFQPVPPAP